MTEHEKLADSIGFILGGVLSTKGLDRTASAMNVCTKTLRNRKEEPEKLTVLEVRALSKLLPEEMKEILRKVIVP